MAILKVARMGHPVLRRKGQELPIEAIRSEKIQRLIQDMVETMHEYSGIGLAAPQVHESLQLAIIEFEEDNSRYPDMGVQPLRVFINPKITVLDSEEQGFWEGCLSVPELRGLVHRPRKVRVDYLDAAGEPQTWVAEDFMATVVQHELDHLEGMLYVDKVRDRTKFAFLEEYRRYWVPAPEDEVGELGD